MECLRNFRRVDGETSLKGRVERSLEASEANAARPLPWTLQTFLVSAFFCRGPPSADDDDVPPRASASGPRKSGMHLPPSALPLPDIPESDVGDAASAGNAASADAVEVMLSDDSPSRRPPAGAAGGRPARKLSHRRSWSWSMQWSAGEASTKARRKHESGERGSRAPAEADEVDEDGFSDVFSREGRGDDDVDEADDSASARVTAREGTGTSTAGTSAPVVSDGSRLSHSRSGSWSDWASVSAASWFASKTPEAREEARRARACRKEQKKRDLADAKALRERAALENNQLDRVMQESKLMHAHSLPLTTRSRDAAAACVFVTPPPKASRIARGPDGGDAEAAEDAAIGSETGSRARSMSRADAGEWVEVELRGMPSRWAANDASASKERPESPESPESPERPTRSNVAETETTATPARTIRASAFFGTLDQRGARGEGSCTLCCVALAEWLAANPGRLPTECLRTTTPERSEAEEAEDGASDASADSADSATFDQPSSQPRFALDFIVTGAAREWRRLCADAALVARFPDKHFDLDTAAALHAPFSVEAEARAWVAESETGDETAFTRNETLRSASTSPRPRGVDGDADPVATATRETTQTRNTGCAVPKRLLRAKIHHGESFVGFLRPPGVAKGDSPALDALSEAAPPLEAIVGELAASAPSTYAVSWNDHFFLLHFRREAGETVAYVMDSLGERLCEGCRRAYVLRFDGASLGGNATAEATDGVGDAAAGLGSKPAGAVAAAAAFIGDVLPSRALRDVSAQILAAVREERNATELDPETLMRRVQIEFHRVEAERA